VIVADTFRRDHLGAYGNPWIRTPYLDEFARSSVVFDHHVLSSFPTMPARADILTGTFSYTHMGWEPLPRHLLSLPEILSKAGYLTMGIVDTPFYIRNGFGYDRGFDDFVWVRGQGDDTRPHERALSFLERVGTPEEYLAPRRKALDGWRRVVRSCG
jgi:arylsulfatase A-like enzyme